MIEHPYVRVTPDQGRGTNIIEVLDRKTGELHIGDTGERANQTEPHALTMMALYYAIEAVHQLEVGSREAAISEMRGLIEKEGDMPASALVAILENKEGEAAKHGQLALA